MKALCAVDGSKFSQWAVETLRNVFHPSLREVLLVHVLDTSLLEAGLKKEGTTPAKTKKILKTLETEATKTLKAAENHARKTFHANSWKASVKIRSVLAKGHTAHTLVKEAEKRKPHLIVLGTRGFYDMKGYFMGSVSRKVLSYAPCPVFMVKESVHRPVKIVLAVDGSDASTRAAKYLCSWMPPEAVSVHVLSVAPKTFRGLGSRVHTKPYSHTLRQAIRKEAQETIVRVRTLLMKKHFQVTAEVGSGDPRATILDCLVHREASLAVLGAKGLTGPERFHLGSVSEWVAAYAGCSMLVVRPSIKGKRA